MGKDSDPGFNDDLSKIAASQIPLALVVAQKLPKAVLKVERMEFLDWRLPRLSGARRMMKPQLSVAASGLLRAILTRTGVDRDRILICDWTSTDWQSLTFVGERHVAMFRITGSNAARLVAMIANGLEEAEFLIPGQIVADIGLAEPPAPQPDGSILVTIEALTVGE